MNTWDLDNDDDDVFAIEDPFSQYSKVVDISEDREELSSELEVYFMERTKIITTKNKLGTQFDILLWWRLNNTKYPILANIARDVLVIPVPTISYESTFSTEVLILTQNWLWSSFVLDLTTNIHKLI